MKKTKVLPENTGTVISKLENYIFVPALVFSTFSTYCTRETIKENYLLIVYSSVALLIAFLIAIPLSNVFYKKGEYANGVYRYALVFANFSFMGNAIVPAILGGEEFLYLYLLFTLPLNAAVYTWGIRVLTPKELRSKSRIKNLINPIFLSLASGAVFGVFNLGRFLPAFLLTSINYFKNCMAPLAMFLTGFIIGGYSLKELLSNKKVYFASLMRLIALPVIIIFVLWVLGARQLSLVFCLFSFATPLGINTVVFPAAFGTDTKAGASMALISHILCVITIPVMYSILVMIIR